MELVGVERALGHVTGVYFYKKVALKSSLAGPNCKY